MDRDTYFLIYKRIMRALAEETEDEYDESEAEEYAQDDWRSESRDGISMPREVFLDSLFQIADLYTDLANEHEYGSFLARILQRCVGKDGVFYPGVKPRKRPPKKPATPKKTVRLTTPEEMNHPPPPPPPPEPSRRSPSRRSHQKPRRLPPPTSSKARVKNHRQSPPSKKMAHGRSQPRRTLFEGNEETELEGRHTRVDVGFGDGYIEWHSDGGDGLEGP